MKDLRFYSDVLKCSGKDAVFEFLVSNLKPSNRLWSFFVNWEKVLNNTKKVEVELNLLNYLIGKEDFDKEFRFLVEKNPEVVKVIPLLAVRDGSNNKKFKILVNYEKKRLDYEDYDFDNDKPTKEDINKYLKFIERTGVKKLIASKKIKNLVDYILGVEAGLDSNARKNRGGDVMENIVEVFIKDVCQKKNIKYIKEANKEKIKKELGYDVPIDKSSRRYDFAIDNGKELFIIETNFYGGGGTKIKSTAGEYKPLNDILKGKFKFIWITDGLGWKTANLPLRETFEHNDYIFNLKMLEKGILEYLI